MASEPLAFCNRVHKQTSIVDVNGQGRDGTTALMLASASAHESVAYFLLQVRGSNGCVLFLPAGSSID